MHAKRIGQMISYFVALMLTIGTVIPTAHAAETIEIIYWQPANNGTGRIAAMDTLIERFEAANPTISVTVVREINSTGPVFEDALEFALREGEGPHVVTLFNGWIPDWAARGLLVPLPQGSFDPTEIERDFYSIVNTSQFEGAFWALPSGVRSMALYYNIEHFDAMADELAVAGLGYPNETWTWDNFLTAVNILNEVDEVIGSEENIVGFDWVVDGWGHHWLREVLVPQFSGQSFVDSLEDSIWGSEGACAAFTYALSTEERPTTTDEELAFIAERGVSRGAYFDAGLASMHIDGSFRIANLGDSFEYGVAELPTLDGTQRTFGSFWAHGLTPQALNESPEQRIAAIQFVQFITSRDAARIWGNETSEIPARTTAPLDQATPQILPFVEGLNYAYATPFINEAAQRDILSTAYNSVIEDSADPCDALRGVDANIQELIDDFNEDRERWELGTGFANLRNP